MRRNILFIFLILSYPSILYSLEVSFKNDAVVAESMLTLADVAFLRPFSKAEILSGLELFPSPSPGEKRCFDNSILKAYVLEAVVNKDSIQWSGSDIVCVRRDGVIMNQNRIQSIIDAKLREIFGHFLNGQVFFKAVNLPDLPDVPTGLVEYEVLFSDRDVLKSKQVNVVIKVDGRVRENLKITGQVQSLLPVVVAVEKLSRGTILTRDNIMAQIKNIAELKDPCLDPDAIIGRVLKKSVSINQVISEHDLDMPVLIERKQVVTMFLQKGGLEISTKGLASANGKMDDVIMIKNLKSNREVPCRVIGPGMTMVEY
jgi:flagellar basal body P-ring formation protein FlgA